MNVLKRLFSRLSLVSHSMIEIVCIAFYASSRGRLFRKVLGIINFGRVNRQFESLVYIYEQIRLRNEPRRNRYTSPVSSEFEMPLE